MIEPDLPANRTSDREHLSALMDGECEPDAVARACRLWRDDPDACAQWHVGHLIGDVLRSDDLARDPGRDAAFLQDLRARLAREPVVLAPQPVRTPEAPPAAVRSDPRVVPLAERRDRRSPLMRMRRWVAPVGMAAGVALVTGAVLVTRPDATPARDGSGGGVMLVAAPVAQAQAPTLAAAGSAPAAPVRLTEPGAEAELVRYLDAHQQFPSSAATGAAGFLRSAAYESPAK